MTRNQELAIEHFRKLIGVVEGPSEWLVIDQERIDAFADATLDHQFIHVDPERARATPFGGTIAHGFLTLSLLPHLHLSIPRGEPAALNGLAMAINYGLDRVRFPAAVPVGRRLRATRELLTVEPLGPQWVQTCERITIELEGSDRPACVAELLTRWSYP